MKPLLIIPPCPARWHALENLLNHESASALADVEKRFTVGVENSDDAFAVIPDGGQILASARIAKRADTGVLGQVFTRVDHRNRGHARRLIEALVSWFDMVGGKWLYAAATDAVADRLLGKFGFGAIHRTAGEPQDRLMTLRKANDVGADPLGAAVGDVAVRDATRADYPLIVSLLQHRPGPDPRASLDISATAAEATALDLLDQQERGTCRLKAAVRDGRIVGLASVATDQLGKRTFAMQMPHSDPLPELREATVEFAGSKGYPKVDFPLEALAEDRETPDVPVAGGES